jgi:uncharacterized phage protein (TIGR02218 family)
MTRSEADAWFDYGLLTWQTGANQGISTEIKKFSSGTFVLWLPAPFNIVVGDQYQLYAGCDKRMRSCSNKFNNISNFGGFPHLPGLDAILNYPDSRA